jgi:hypothetical protein
MVRGTVAGLHEYVAAVHAAPEFVGVRDFHRRFAHHLGHERTLARHRHEYRSSLRVFPSFTIEALGLSHVHVVVLGADERWLRFPYAVEHAWATRDFAQHALYLHCLVPTEHVVLVEKLVHDLEALGWGMACLVLRSQSGWQHFSRCGHHLLSQSVGVVPEERVLLRQHPLVVPVIAEAWNHDATLPLLWQRIDARLGRRVREYLPHRRVLHTNGKHHTRAACLGLAAAGLFRQQLVRFLPEAKEGIEVLLMDRDLTDHMVELLEELHGIARVSETYADRDGTIVERVLGSSAVLDAIIRTTGTLGSSARIFLVDKRSGSREVRFCYEFLFDPKTGTWVFPREQIVKHMTSP